MTRALTGALALFVIAAAAQTGAANTILGNVTDFTSAAFAIENYDNTQPVDSSAKYGFTGAYFGDGTSWTVVGGQSHTAKSSVVEHVFVQYNDVTAGCLSGTVTMTRYTIPSPNFSYTAPICSAQPHNTPGVSTSVSIDTCATTKRYHGHIDLGLSFSTDGPSTAIGWAGYYMATSAVFTSPAVTRGTGDCIKFYWN